MTSIRHALTERWYLWEDARRLAESDPEIDLSNISKPFMPMSYFEDEHSNGQPEELTQPDFMAEQPGTTKPEDIEPATLPPENKESQQPPIKP
jgi:large subunit ribosomal protein L47